MLDVNWLNIVELSKLPAFYSLIDNVSINTAYFIEPILINFYNPGLVKRKRVEKLG